GDAERGERKEEQRQRYEPAPGAAGHDAGQDLEVGEPDRVAHAPSFGEQEEPDRRRDDEQGEKEEGMPERHGALEQSAWTWTTARTPNKASSEETETLTPSRRSACVPLTVAVSAPLAALAGKRPGRS